MGKHKKKREFNFTKKDAPDKTTEGIKEKEPKTWVQKDFTKTRLFCYGTLNIHSIQRAIWGEAKDGKTGRILDYELKMFPGSTIFYVERKLGECVAGKVYELTDDQLKSTDMYEGKGYKRVSLLKNGIADVEVYVAVKEDKE